MKTLSTPIASAAGAVTYPAAGVMPTRPTTAPVPEEPGRDERGHARADMDDSAASEVERAHLLEPAARPPHPVGQRRVHQRGPEDEEGEIGAEPHPLDDGARDKRRCDHGKHRL